MTTTIEKKKPDLRRKGNHPSEKRPDAQGTREFPGVREGETKNLELEITNQ